MKVCPQCTTGFPDSHTTCPTHGGYLSEIVDLRPGMMIRNSYRILRKLGEGGMGSVYLAEQTLMEEPRALKFLSRQWSRDEGFTARFRREVRTLRQVRHKNVVDSGDLERAEDDTLFFAMEFVEGPDLRDFLFSAPRPFDVKLALEIVRGIAEGLGAAHAKGMVHRDIKPENILMACEGDSWVPKIADFGIVATKESSTTRTRTGSGSLLTWAYAAPEQWRGMRSTELDGRTDLYALGGVLFEMLTGQTVFDADSYEGWAEQHKNSAPRAPSSVRPELSNWKGLDELVLRLLAKDRELRHSDTAELLSLLDTVGYLPEVKRLETSFDEEAKNHLEAVPEVSRVQTPSSLTIQTEPIQPDERQVSNRNSKRKWMIAVPLFLMLALAVGVIVWGGRSRANAVTNGIPQPPKSVVVLHTLQGSPDIVGFLVFSPDSHTLASVSKATITLWDSANGTGLHTLVDHAGSVNSVAFSPDGHTLASGSDDKTVKLWDAGSGQVLRTLSSPGYVNSVAFSPDGSILAYAIAPAYQGDDSFIKLWDLKNQRARTFRVSSDVLQSVAFSPDGRTLASGSPDSIKLWDVSSGKVLRVMPLGAKKWQIMQLAFSHDGNTLISGSTSGLDSPDIDFWDVSSGKKLRTLSGAIDADFGLSPDGHTLAAGARPDGASKAPNAVMLRDATGSIVPSGSATHNAVMLWDARSGKELFSMQGHTNEVVSVAFSPDGRTLASGSWDKSIKLWDVSAVNK
jgi:WD40 repeat protein